MWIINLFVLVDSGRVPKEDIPIQGWISPPEPANNQPLKINRQYSKTESDVTLRFVDLWYQDLPGNEPLSPAFELSQIQSSGQTFRAYPDIAPADMCDFFNKPATGIKKL